MTNDTINSPRLRIMELETGQPARELILAAYQRTGSLSGAARELGVSRPTLDKWLAALGGGLRLVFGEQQTEDHP